MSLKSNSKFVFFELGGLDLCPVFSIKSCYCSVGWVIFV